MAGRWFQTSQKVTRDSNRAPTQTCKKTVRETVKNSPKCTQVDPTHSVLPKKRHKVIATNIYQLPREDRRMGHLMVHTMLYKF